MAKKMCSIKDCDNKHFGKGYCINHYMVWRRNGSPLPTYGRTHGMSKSPEYTVWQNMKSRCYYLGDISYKNYGGRGIKVCDRWLDSFANFLEDMGRKPEGATIERINNDGDYEPGNCKWLPRRYQNYNQRISKNNRTGHKGIYKNKYGIYEVYIGINGKKKNLGRTKDYAEALDIRGKAEDIVQLRMSNLKEGN